MLELCRLKKDVQLESCELSFIWGEMRTAAQEAATKIALRDCSKAAVGESQCIRCHASVCSLVLCLVTTKIWSDGH